VNAIIKQDKKGEQQRKDYLHFLSKEDKWGWGTERERKKKGEQDQKE
jgi:hypothetical protein